jgi:hypothetical protein
MPCRSPAPRLRALAVRCAAALLALPAAAPAQDAPGEADDTSYPARCGVAPPSDERRGYVALPRGDVFCPLLADPKAIRSFASYQRGNARDFATNVGAVGIADQFGFFRIGRGRAGDGVQLGVSAAVFAQFDLAASSFDLLNADYVIGLPLTARRGGTSGRLRVYHQSSHLGDEFLLRPDRPERENLSFESVELLLSQDVGPLRVYGGGEWFVNRNPADLPEALLHGGFELRQRRGVALGTAGRARLVAAVDVKTINDRAWTTGVSARAGIEVGRVREGAAPARRWSLLGEFYDGPSPYGQFQASTVRLTGLGFHFQL